MKAVQREVINHIPLVPSTTRINEWYFNKTWCNIGTNHLV